MRPLPIVLMLFLGVAGCSQQTVSSPISSGQLAMLQARAATSFKVIYSFKGSPDGAVAPPAEAGLAV